MNAKFTGSFILFCVLLIGLVKTGFAQSCNGTLGGPSLACVGGSHSYFLFGGTAGSGSFTNSDVSGVQGVTRTVNGSTITWLQSGNYTINFQTPCGVVPKVITVNSSSATGGTASVSPAGTICPGQVGVTVSVTGHISSVTNWEKRYSGGSWISLGVGGSTLPTQYVDVTTEADYRAFVQGNCGATAYSALAHVTFTTFGSNIFLTGGGTYCNGTYVTLSLNNSESGTTYKLKRPDGSFGTSYAGPGVISWYNETQSGVYSVTATKGGCSAPITSGALVTITPDPIVYTLSGNTQICSGGTTVLSLNGSEAGATYALRRIDNGFNITVESKAGTGSAISFTPTSIVGTLHVVATKSSCTSVTNSLTTTVVSSPAAPAFGEIRQFCGFARVRKATNDPNWYWLPNATTFVETNNAEEIIVSANTTLYLGAKGSGGCWTVVSQAVTISNSLPSVAVASSQSAICNGGSVTLTASGATFYIWHDNAGNVMAESAVYTTPNLTTTTSFLVTGYDAKGCYHDVSTSITVWPDEPLVPNKPFLTKPSGAFALNINNVNNTPANFTYFWQSTPDGTASAPFVDPRTSVPAGLYYVRARNVRGCWGPPISIEVPDLTPPVYPTAVNNATVNYVRKYSYQQKNVPGTNPDLNTPDQVGVSTQYIDGIGRPMQVVTKMATPLPLQKDLVEPIDYDAFGRTDRKYLPYASSTSSGDVQAQPFTLQKTFYQLADKVAHSDLALSYTDFEDSPLNRAKAEFSPGETWVGTVGLNTAIGIKKEYSVNIAAEPVRRFDVVAAGISSVGIFADASLGKTKTFDEQGNEAIEFVNKNGQIILKRIKASATEWADTYYVYDDFGNLTYVLPPELVKSILAQPQPYTPTQTALDNLAFQYKYDGRNRMVEKKVPGAGWVYMVYDGLDRVVLAQDGNQRLNTDGTPRATKEWIFTKYDAFNRPVTTGKYINNGTRVVVQDAVNLFYVLPLATGRAFHEKYINATAGNVLGYDNKSFPSVTNIADYLTVTYYDVYDATTAPTSHAPVVELPGQEIRNPLVVGQVTGTLVKNLNTGAWLRTVNYYDSKYRVTQNISDHPKGKIVTTSVLDFTGKTLLLKRSYLATPVSTYVLETYNYDHVGRLNWIKHSINGSADIVLVKNEYNELGQLIDKKLHSTVVAATDARQSVDYRYNIRGWLTSINNSQLANDGSTNNDTGDYFGMDFGYNSDIGIGNAPQYNGNISGIKWSNLSGIGTIKENAYVYTYDQLNRLGTAAFKEKGTSWSLPVNNAYAETGFSYDLNGNIKALTRYDKRANGIMDNLTYTYANSNQLLRVTDAGDKFNGFIDGTNTVDDYTYDPNGNMITDQNKGITSAIVYNYLNLPQTIIRGLNQANYHYDATGQKMSQLTTFGGIVKKTDYMGEVIYENDAPQFVNHAEGRIVMAGTKLVYTHAGGNTSGFTAYNSVTPLTNVTQNGGETYVKVTSNGITSRSGVFSIGGAFLVLPGDRYKIRVKGYRDKGTAASSSAAHLLIKVNQADLNWPGATLPVSSATAQTESWIEQIITVPGSGSVAVPLEIGVVWNTVLSGEIIYINEFEVTKLTNTAPEYQYHIKDHLGNIRLTFSTVATSDQSVATMETVNAPTEQSQYLYYDEAVKINSVLFNHTNDASSGVTVAVTGVNISPSTLTLAPTQTGQLTNVVVPANATNQAVTWSSNNTAVATVTNSGAVTGITAGTATISVTTTSGSFVASSVVTVVAAGGGTVAVTGVSVSPTTASLTIGGTTTVQLIPTITPANATTQTVTWTSSNTGVATVNSTGLVTAVAAGTATITAASVSNPTVTGTSAITVNGAVSGPSPLIALKFNETSGVPVNTGTLSSAFTRSATTPLNSTNVPATVGGARSLDFGTTAGNYYVESSGIINGLKSLPSFTITGWLNGKSNVIGDGGNRIVSWSWIDNGAEGVDLVHLGDGKLQIGINQWPDFSTAVSTAGKLTFNASAPATNWVFFAVTYQSSTSEVKYYFGNNASDATLDATQSYNRGVLGSNIQKLAIGHFNDLTRPNAPDRMFKGLMDEIQIFGSALTPSQIVGIQRGTSSTVAVTGVSVSPTTASITIGGTTTVQLTRTIAPANATNQTVTWTSSNTGVATVNSTGLVTAVAPGSSTITVSTSEAAFTAQSVITVTSGGGGTVKVTGLSLSPTALTLTPGQTSQLSKTVAPAGASNLNVGWISSNAAVATVSATGLVTAVSSGTATVTATSLDGGFTSQATVTVNAPGGPTFYSTRLAGTPTERNGLTKSISVMPGDVITTEVFAKYLDTNSANWTTALSTFMASIAQGTAPAGTRVDGGLPGSTGGAPWPFPPLDHGSETGTQPKAYLNYIVFDKNLSATPLDFGFKRITTAAREYGQDGAHERLAFEGAQQIVIKEPGYVIIYISNESATQVDVFFDDFKVTHTKSPVVQSDDYYPFGLTFNSYKRENSVVNQHLYNGKEKQDELGLDWLDYGARMYQPEIGRWAVIDKKAEVYINLTQYCYAANTPVNAIDPDGNLVVFINGLSWGDGGSRSYWQGNEYVKVGETYSGQRYGEMFYRPVYEATRIDIAQTFNDHFGQDMNKARFVDGAPWNSGDTKYRIEKGYEKGKEDAAVLIQSLDRTGGVITEPLILATHSLGSAFGRGYLKAIIEYVNEHPEQCKGLSISVYDFDPYDANLLSQVSGISITQILHKSKFGLANEIEQGVSEKDGSLINDTGKSNSHSVKSFISSISSLKPGKYVFNGTSFVKVEEKKKKKKKDD